MSAGRGSKAPSGEGARSDDGFGFGFGFGFVPDRLSDAESQSFLSSVAITITQHESIFWDRDSRALLTLQHELLSYPLS